MSRLFAAVLEVAGIAAVSVAGFITSVPLGWLAIGVGLLAIGVATERGAS